MTPEVPAPDLAGDALIDTPDNAETPATAPARGLSILVAEDNEINALLMRSLLTRLGHLPSSPPMARRHWNPGWRPNPPARRMISC